MTDFSEKHCEPCNGGFSPLTMSEATALSHQLTSWQIETGSPLKLRKDYQFADYLSALAFVNAVAEMAEVQGHHPSMQLDWGQVGVSWWTHAINGLHENDFICAAKTDVIFDECQ